MCLRQAKFDSCTSKTRSHNKQITTIYVVQVNHTKHQICPKKDELLCKRVPTTHTLYCAKEFPPHTLYCAKEFPPHTLYCARRQLDRFILD